MNITEGLNNVIDHTDLPCGAYFCVRPCSAEHAFAHNLMTSF